MHGELILDNGKTGRRILAALLAAGVLSWLAALWLGRFAHLEGLALQIVIAIAVVAVQWLIYGRVRAALPRDKRERRLAWTVTDTALTLGDDTIPRAQIRMVHCWKKPEGWIVNIEVKGRNRLLRAQNTDKSAASLRELVKALGYENRWSET